MRLGHRPGPGALVVGLLCTVVVAGCGGNSGSGSAAGAGPRLEAPINLADCRDWNAGSVEDRLGTIAQIREFTGGPVQGTNGTGVVLEDEQAYDLFESACAEDHARAFRLYKLYGRAAAFSGS